MLLGFRQMHAASCNCDNIPRVFPLCGLPHIGEHPDTTDHMRANTAHLRVQAAVDRFLHTSWVATVATAAIILNALIEANWNPR